jgi:PAS domain S-box-containing protein
MSADKIRLLLVEDDAVDRMAFTRHLEREHLPYSCKTADSIAAAKELLQTQTFDIILLDHTLPDGLGFDLMPSVGDTPVVFVTGSESPENAVRAMKVGASDYLLKDHDRTYLRLMPLAVERALDQRVARNQLRESQTLFRQSFQEAPIGKAFVQPDGRFLRVNTALCEITGVTEDELLANGFQILFNTTPKPGCIEKLFPTSTSGGVRQRTERTSRNKKGEEIIVQLDIARMPESAGHAATCVLHVQDITAKKRSEETHSRLEKQLYQAQKMEALGSLAGGVAHEFNNMLGAIVGYTELARMELGESSPAYSSLGEVLKASNRAKDIVRQILTFSRRQDLKRELIHVQPMIADAVKLIRPILPSNVEVISHTHTEGAPVFGNTTQIQQALINLCTNSCHAIGENSGNIQIDQETVFLRRDNMPPRVTLPEGKYVVLTIADNGQGMDEATLARVFEPFFTTKGPGRGTGLGMPVVEGIMKAHDGAVSISTEMGRGTKVHLYFPASSGQAAEHAVEKPTLPLGKGQRIMLVDDEITLVQLGSMMLQRLGYAASSFTSPQEALDALCRKPKDFDLIITDLTMPVMSGLEFSSACHQVRPDLPIILASGFVEDAIRGEATYLGIGKILGKPLNISVLAEAVHSLLVPSSQKVRPTPPD